jgi:hypothetical protein
VRLFVIWETSFAPDASLSFFLASSKIQPQGRCRGDVPAANKQPFFDLGTRIFDTTSKAVLAVLPRTALPRSKHLPLILLSAKHSFLWRFGFNGSFIAVVIPKSAALHVLDTYDGQTGERVFF